MNTTKTCPKCLGKGEVIINAGTGLKADCAKCKPTTKRINGHHHNNITEAMRQIEASVTCEQDAGR